MPIRASKHGKSGTHSSAEAPSKPLAGKPAMWSQCPFGSEQNVCPDLRCKAACVKSNGPRSPHHVNDSSDPDGRSYEPSSEEAAFPIHVAHPLAQMLGCIYARIDPEF